MESVIKVRDDPQLRSSPLIPPGPQLVQGVDGIIHHIPALTGGKHLRVKRFEDTREYGVHFLVVEGIEALSRLVRLLHHLEPPVLGGETRPGSKTRVSSTLVSVSLLEGRREEFRPGETNTHVAMMVEHLTVPSANRLGWHDERIEDIKGDERGPSKRKLSGHGDDGRVGVVHEPSDVLFVGASTIQGSHLEVQ